MDLGGGLVFSMIATVVALLLYVGQFLLFVKKLDKETFKDKKVYKWLVIVGVSEVLATFIFTYLRGNYVLFALVMPYISFFVFCDILIQKTYDILNYVFLVLAVLIVVVGGASFSGDVIGFAAALAFIVFGYLRVYGVADGYMLAVITLLLIGCDCKVFAFPFLLLILSAFCSVVFVHLPVYVYKKVKKEEVNFWKARNAFGPAIYIGFIVIMTMDILNITL